MRALCSIALATAILVTAGCGSSGPFEYTPASGKITYEDGTLIPAPSMRVIFTALDHQDDPQFKPRPAMANFNAATGEFDSVTSYKFGDGLVSGRHRVALAAVDATGKDLKLFPEVYSDIRKSPLIIDTADLPLVIKVPKP